MIYLFLQSPAYLNALKFTLLQLPSFNKNITILNNFILN